MSTTGFQRVNALLLAGLLACAVGSSGCGGKPSVKISAKGPGDTGVVRIDGPRLDFKTDEVEVPFILWGGDVATFLANGGLVTRPGTLFHKQGLRLKLTRGDDFDKQVENYLQGKSPFLRGTMSMLGQASEKVGKSENSRPVVFLQLTWSAGDHLVARPDCKMLSDLKGKKIALQKGGPHVGMLNDILRTASLTWQDIQPVWTDDVTGDKGPAALFRKDAGVDACFAITPDMTDLTGGLDKKGTGEAKTVKDAHVLVSTAHMSHSIADVYACRKDFFDAHRDWVEKFTAGYLKACEELVAMRKVRLEKDGGAKYKALLQLTQDIYGKDDIKSLDDADGLISDAAFVGLPGNVSFFTDRGNLSGFEPKMRSALDLAIALGDAKGRYDFLSAGLDYERLKKLGDLTGKAPPAERFRDDVKFLTEDTIYFFTISFEPNQSVFPEREYGEAFQRALEQASLFGKTIMAVRGHADSTNLLEMYRKTGLDAGSLKRGSGPDEYILRDGSKLDLKNARKVVELIGKDNFGNDSLNKSVQYLQDLSQKRAETVRGSVVEFAKSRGLRLDLSQIKSVGAGATDPIVALPRTDDEMARNRRVEFRIIRVSPEAIRAGDGFDY
jgi:ABC-type nitrate/sulfonate/bicarbonate transport system substrate-binding protein